MNIRRIPICLLTVGCAVTAVATVLAPRAKADAPVAGRLNLAFCCAADNDLYRVMTASGEKYGRYDSAGKAIDAAPEGSGVLILADGYPEIFIPGAAQYVDSLDLHVNKALAGQETPREALDAVAVEWEATAKKLNRKKQIKLWRKALDAYRALGLIQ